MKNSYAFTLWLITLVILAGLTLNFNQGIQEIVREKFDQPDSNVDEAVSQVFLIDNKKLSTGNPLIQEEQPLQFVFPTPGSPPVSFWRPPLYETPWGLTPNDHFLFSRPIAADVVNWPLADYRYGYFFPGTDIVHTGIDIDAPRGTPVLAAASGTVVWTGYGLYYGSYNEEDPYGIAVSIRHDFGWGDNRLLTVYAHMDEVTVTVGQKVETGTQVGIVGLTGFTTGPHLHFEVRMSLNSYYRTRNPELWLAPPQGWGVLVGQVRKSDYSYIQYQDVFIKNIETNQLWMVRTYGPSSVNRDDYYQENLVLSDLPQGEYILYFNYEGDDYKYNFSIFPGAISFFKFQENIGFSSKLPAPKTPQNMQNVILTDDFSN
ncbi:MAG: hypothetical protein BGO78_00475 [Chloroflexi bacterium 44-23]|nr:MAG: hypothetical protein BGO78_00475 [Chloroflexi bacterium 44-23]